MCDQLSRRLPFPFALLQIRAPRVTWNLEALSSVLHNDAAVKVVLSSESGPELYGALHRVRQLRPVDNSNVRVGEDVILFIGTPHMTTLEDMATHNLYISGACYVAAACVMQKIDAVFETALQLVPAQCARCSPGSC